MLARLSAHAMNRPVLWIAVFILLTVGWAVGLGRLQIRTEGAAIYPTGNDVIRQTRQDLRTFRDPRELVLLVTVREGSAASLLSRGGLLYLKHIHESLGRLDGLHPAGVISLARIPNGLPEEMSQPFPTLLDSVPGDPSSFGALLGEIHDDPVANGLFVSPDGTAAALYIGFLIDRESRDIIHALQTWIGSQETPDYALHLMGPLAAETTLGDMVLDDLARLIPIMVGVIALLLFLFLGTRGGVLIPMVEALMVLVWVFGAMGYCGVPVTLMTTVLPVVLMAMGITDQIHLLERLQARLANRAAVAPTGPAARVRITKAMAASLEDVGWPIVATSLTTALAFLSFLSASINPVRQFGLFASIGILLAMLFTFTFIPALAVVLPTPWFTRRRSASTRTGFESLFLWEKRAARQSGRAWMVGILLVVAGLPGVRLLTVQDSWVGNFDPRSPLPTADRRFNDEFWGSYRFDVVLKGGRWFFYQPEGVALIEELSRVAADGPHVGGVLSHLVPLEQVADEYDLALPLSSLPEADIRRLGGGARLAMGAPFMRLLVAPDGASARIRIFVNGASYERGIALEEYLEGSLQRLTDGSDVSYHFSGDLAAAVEVVRAIVTNQLRSVGWTLLGIAVLLFVTLRKIREALIIMIPVLAADWILFAGLGYAGVPLGIATSMFASLTIGVGIDYALHLRHSYRQSAAVEPDHTSALVKAMGSTGRAIRWNAFALGIGFLVLGFSSIPPNRALGILLSSAMITCYVTTLLFLPRLLHLTPPRDRRAPASRP